MLWRAAVLNFEPRNVQVPKHAGHKMSCKPPHQKRHGSNVSHPWTSWNHIFIHFLFLFLCPNCFLNTQKLLGSSHSLFKLFVDGQVRFHNTNGVLCTEFAWQLRIPLPNTLSKRFSFIFFPSSFCTLEVCAKSSEWGQNYVCRLYSFQIRQPTIVFQAF